MNIKKVLAKVSTWVKNLNLRLSARSPLLVKTGLSLIAAIGLIYVAASATNDTSLATPQDYKEHLRLQVESADGTPLSGRDPTSQNQSGLASVASKPSQFGPSDQPAAGVNGDHSYHVEPDDVYGDPTQTGIGANGCYLDYGTPGVQCLPAHAAQDKQLTCAGVLEHFPEGISVSGEDRFHLDTNLDGVACGAADY